MNDRSAAGVARRVLVTDLGFTEGPVIGEDGTLFAVAINRGIVYHTVDGAFEILATTGGGPNGATQGADGSIYIAQNGCVYPDQPGPQLLPRPAGMTGGIQRVTRDGTVDWVNMDPVSPNDLCFGPDGLLYFTDPTRPLGGRDSRLFRADASTHDSELLVTVDWYTNGLAFGLEDDALYVANTQDAQILRFPLDSKGLGRPEVVVQMTAGMPDGFTFDIDGHLVVPAIFPDHSQRGEIQTWTIDGELLDVFPLDAGYLCTNAALGVDRTLVVAASDLGQILAFDGWPSAGLPLHPFR